ncbi:hypothetical protein BKA58DRAFT_461037 [Alternaria rosae]|uniref:uncharacterized protein n=1 Tax=Alternaria rosae TaxID=1187941 RepID=UPI001E8CBBBD|nr:uncharacterized protein BKA58DRAFT_461037 [Alternaria rosae]KAH6867094.1 hypothetical protein BKA58DRAFT_461037 [Alternaria rosae]
MRGMAGTAGSQRYGWSFARVAHKRAGGRSRTCPGAVALRVLAPRAWHPPGPPLVLVVTLPALLAAWRAFKRTAGPDRCCCLDVRLVVLRAGHMLPKTVPPPFALDAGAEFERRGTLVASRYPSSPFRFGPYANLARTVAADAHAWPYAMTTTVARTNMHITLSPSSFLFAHPQVHGQHALLWRPKAACLLLNNYHAAAPTDVRALQPSPSLTSAAPALTQRTAPVCCSRIPHEAALPSCSTAFVEGQRRTGLSAAA